jgi:hypothetical protein
MEPLKEMDLIEARFKGGTHWYAGQITKRHSDTLGNITYDVRYQDGDSETHVPSDCIRKGKMESLESLDGIRVNDEVDWLGRMHGRVIAVHANGTLTIRLEGGSVQTNVKRDQISINDSDPCITNALGLAFIEGEGVKARQTGFIGDGDKYWVPGTVKKV